MDDEIDYYTGWFDGPRRRPLPPQPTTFDSPRTPLPQLTTTFDGPRRPPPTTGIKRYSYNPDTRNKKIEQKVYISNLPSSFSFMDKEKLEEVLKQFGVVTDIFTKTRYTSSGKTMAFAIVEFESEECAIKAVNEGKNQKLVVEGQEIKIDHYIPEHIQRGCNLYFKNFSADSLTADDLRKMFTEYGAIRSLKVEFGTPTCPKAFGYVCYKTPTEASEAIKHLHNKPLPSGSLFHVAEYESRAARDRRAVGGAKYPSLSTTFNNSYFKNLTTSTANPGWKYDGHLQRGFIGQGPSRENCERPSQTEAVPDQLAYVNSHVNGEDSWDDVSQKSSGVQSSQTQATSTWSTSEWRVGNANVNLQNGYQEFVPKLWIEKPLEDSDKVSQSSFEIVSNQTNETTHSTCNTSVNADNISNFSNDDYDNSQRSESTSYADRFGKVYWSTSTPKWEADFDRDVNMYGRGGKKSRKSQKLLQKKANEVAEAAHASSDDVVSKQSTMATTCPTSVNVNGDDDGSDFIFQINLDDSNTSEETVDETVNVPGPSSSLKYHEVDGVFDKFPLKPTAKEFIPSSFKKHATKFYDQVDCNGEIKFVEVKVGQKEGGGEDPPDDSMNDEVSNSNNDDDLLSIEWIKANCKQCPKCKVNTEKISGGCNNIRCTLCNTPWCWVCGGDINGNLTEHFELVRLPGGDMCPFMEEADPTDPMHEEILKDYESRLVGGDDGTDDEGTEGDDESEDVEPENAEIEGEVRQDHWKLVYSDNEENDLEVPQNTQGPEVAENTQELELEHSEIKGGVIVQVGQFRYRLVYSDEEDNNVEVSEDTQAQEPEAENTPQVSEVEHSEIDGGETVQARYRLLYSDEEEDGVEVSENNEEPEAENTQVSEVERSEIEGGETVPVRYRLVRLVYSDGEESVVEVPENRQEPQGSEAEPTQVAEVGGNHLEVEATADVSEA